MTLRVLGLGGSNHDFSAALVEDGELRVAIEDERIQRVRHGRHDWSSQPARDAAEYCLDALSLKLDDVDLIVANDDLERPRAWMDWSLVTFLNHHTAHASASFFTSPATQAALLVVDGHGSALDETSDSYRVETISIGFANRSHLSLQPLQTGHQRRTSSSWRYIGDNSIGALYEIVTVAIGFGDEGQGKTMGLAAYGQDRLTSPLRDFVTLGEDGTFLFDPYAGISDWLVTEIERADNQFQVRADLAYAVQQVFGDAIVAAAQAAYDRYPSPTLSFGGGCSLNTVANSRILNETAFETLHIFPAGSDDGLAVGCALYGYYSILGRHPRDGRPGWRGRSVYLGREYSPQEIETALASRSVSARKSDRLASDIARELAEGAVVALHRGKAEIGPRALGHRSLLAAAHSARLRDHINLNVKERESFRPLAPVVPIEAASTYFEGPAESPFMLLVFEVRPEFRDRLAAVTHADGTARIQTVRAEDNPFLHELLTEYGRITGIPVLVNTSLNLPGAPIVETPEDALDVFLQRPIDLLVLGDVLVRKYTPWARPARPPGA